VLRDRCDLNRSRQLSLVVVDATAIQCVRSLPRSEVNKCQTGKLHGYPCSDFVQTTPDSAFATRIPVCIKAFVKHHFNECYSINSIESHRIEARRNALKHEMKMEKFVLKQKYQALCYI